MGNYNRFDFAKAPTADFEWKNPVYTALAIRRGHCHPIHVDLEYDKEQIEHFLGGAFKVVYPGNLPACEVICAADEEIAKTPTKVSRDNFKGNFIVLGYYYNGGKRPRSLTDEELYAAEKLFHEFAPLYSDPQTPKWKF